MEVLFDRILLKETGFAFDSVDEIEGLVSSWDNPIVRQSTSNPYRKGVTKTGEPMVVVFNKIQAKPITLEGDELLYVPRDVVEAQIVDGQLQPLLDYVLVEPYVPDEILPSGLIVPGVKDEKRLEGIVRGIGAKVNQLEVSQHILYGKVSGHVFSFKGKEYRLMREDQIFGIL